MFSSLLRQSLTQRPTFGHSWCSFKQAGIASLLPNSRHLHIPGGASTWDNMIGDIASNPPQASYSNVEERWKARSRDALSQLARRPPANAYSGRSVKVINGNIADAYKQLETILSRNKVKAQLRLAERHEKKGVKRRRLSSERWRKNFAHEVRQKVQLVSKIRDRGA